MSKRKASVRELKFRISALQRTGLLVAAAFFLMQNYLTDVWKLSFTHAAAILNIWGGIYRILPVFSLFLADVLLGNFKMVMISSIAYSVGIVFVTTSMPPVFAISSGTCRKYEPECIGNRQKFLFYIGMALIAVGIAGNIASVTPFRNEQDDKSHGKKTISCSLPLLLLIISGIALSIGFVVFQYTKPWIWAVLFGVSAICMVSATLVFLGGSHGYKKAKPQGSPITHVCRVLVAAAFKISLPVPKDKKQLYVKDGEEFESFSDTRFQRCLEKAAIILPDVSLEDQKKNRWRLCSLSQVEDAKIVVRMVPMWMTFIVCGIVSSIGNTYFVAQAENMNHKIGKWNAPSFILLLVFGLGKILFNKLASVILRKSGMCGISETCAARIGIAVAMIFSILCCVTAARVEKQRLQVIKSHDLLEKTDEDIPMSAYWLLFQFLLLAGLDSFLQKNVIAFYRNQAPKSMERYLNCFTKGVTGLGFMCGVVSVHVVGKISEVGGKPNWFQYTLNKSRLDRYYWVLAALSSVNLLLFILVDSCYRYRHKEAPDEGVVNDDDVPSWPAEVAQNSGNPVVDLQEDVDAKPLDQYNSENYMPTSSMQDSQLSLENTFITEQEGKDFIKVLGSTSPPLKTRQS